MNFRAGRIALPVLLIVALLSASCGKNVATLSEKDMAPPPKLANFENIGDQALEVAIAGDLMLDDLALPWILKYGYDYPLAGMAEQLKKFDVVVANLEVPVTANCRSSGRHYSYSMMPDGLAALTNANIKVVSLGNNHVLDCGGESAIEEMDLLDKTGISWFGAGRNSKEASTGLIIDVAGTKIGLIGFYGKMSATWPNTQSLTESNMKAGIARMRKEADIVVAVPHWGDNYKPVKDSQISMGHFAIDMGADAVIGHHPHVWQPVEMYKGKPIVYSVGNFAFGTGNTSAKNSLIAVMEIEGKKLKRIKIYPLFNQNRNPEVAWQPKIMKGKDATSFLTKLSDMSEKKDAKLKIENDIGILTL
jgi:hypothetical protein